MKDRVDDEGRDERTTEQRAGERPRERRRYVAPVVVRRQPLQRAILTVVSLDPPTGD